MARAPSQLFGATRHGASDIGDARGTLRCEARVANDKAAVSIAMPLPVFEPTISLQQDLPAAHRVNMGNPHGVIFVATARPG